MISSIIIRPISAQETHLVRHPMLRKNRPIEDCVFEGDDLETTIHIGAFHEFRLVGVASAFLQQHAQLKSKSSYQIRGVATVKEYHRFGIGKALMKEIEEQLTKKNAKLIWLNARINAVPFYRALHYTAHGEGFNIAQIGMHFCYFKRLNDE